MQLKQPNTVYAGNGIRTSKYNVLSFLPLNLMNQYKKAANCYFTVIAYLQTVDLITNTSGKAVILFPLIVVISISMLKDAFEDYKRAKADKVENNRKVKANTNGQFIESRWQEVRVGQLI